MKILSLSDIKETTTNTSNNTNSNVLNTFLIIFVTYDMSCHLILK